MTDTLYPVSGAKIYIGQQLAPKSTDFVESDFSTISWTEIDGWTQAGEFGDTAALITSPIINRKRDVKLKGSRNAGSMANVFAIVPGDEGQAAVVAAEADRDDYAFKIEWDDMPDGGTSPTTHYFIGLVMTAGRTGGDANTPRNLNVTIEVNSNIVEVDAA